MSKKTILSLNAFERIFSERNFNPPPGEADFDDEFDKAIDSLRPILLKHASVDDFCLYGYHNRSRFIDVAFSSEDYMDKSLVSAVQEWLKTMNENWMVCLWEACFLFITRDEIQGFDPLKNTHPFAKLMSEN